ncbi:hypothetical protein HD806DRAFT_497988 [Xylariaceae sp. AK1471]|nr:hypothetical protein HD806DRAFT_497988 [Xylariaceae sp. AK1471]
MFAARVHDQENVAFSRQHGATLKQQQGQTSRQLAPKTPGAKIPLNDENGAHAKTSKALKGGDKTSLLTPMMAPRSRAVLGDKTTNAKTKRLQSVNVKSAVKEIEQSQAKLQNTVRPKQKQLQAETQKLEVHAETTDPLSEEEIEYCPPKPKDLPYESDVFPDGVLTFDALKPENMMKGYYRYYFNPIDEDGKSERDKQMEEETRKAIAEGERQIKEDLDNFEWSIKDELELDSKAFKKASASTMNVSTAPTKKQPAARKPLSTVRSRNAANVLSMDDTTKSIQRKVAKTSESSQPLHKKSSSFAMPGLRTSSRPGISQLSSIPKRSATGLEANSRTTLGYNKGRATASLLTKGSTATTHLRKGSMSTSTSTYRTGLPRSNTTLSNESDKTITPARYAHKQASAAAAAAEDQVWRERVPFLSIFNLEDCNDDDDDDDPLCIKNKVPDFLGDEEEEEFEMKLAD